MPIRNKLILWYTGLLTIIIVIFGATLYSVTRWVLVNSVDRTLAETADEIIRQTDGLPFGEFGSPELRLLLLPELDQFRASGVAVQIWLVDGGSQRFVDASSNLGETAATALDQVALDQAAARDMDAVALDLSATDTPAIFPESQRYTNERLEQGGTVNDIRVLTLPVILEGKAFVFQVAASMVTVNAASSGLLIIMVVAMGFALVGSMALGMGLSNRALQPIDDITRTAERIVVADDLKTRLQWHGPMDELGRLHAVLNQMLGRLEHLFSVQQRFVADVSHELRTPLTVIRGHMELIERYGPDDSSLEAVTDEVDRMQRLVSDLLLLARADYGGLELNKTTLDLDEIVSEVYRAARGLVNGRDLTVEVLDFEAVRVYADPDRLKQLLLNLVGNAVKFTPDGGHISLRLSKTERDAVIEVTDTGIGIAQDDLERIFDRFYQADPSRVRQGDGAGLGLSIAWWIAEAHNGKIRAKSTLGVGTTFTVTLPHLEEPTSVTHQAVTRPRLSLIRRAAPPIQAEEQP
ncbi:MAG: HAMP domain-containing histidine kinase [Chloroflexi bacterium]|nr:HAMP domain-containing histidine kinase [Chloroflexota bacterium]